MSNRSLSELPIEIREQIDSACCAFEEAWTSGETPNLREHLDRIDEPGRACGLRELLFIESNYRRGPNGAPVTDEDLIGLHGNQIPTIHDALSNAPLRHERGRVQATGVVDPTEDFDAAAEQPGIGSHGLHIRCPHCSNPVELLTDAASESVRCSACGSAFSLVDRGEETKQASTLETIGRFELISRLGVGGFGTVWKARDTELDRTVAVKIPRKGKLDDSEVEQFYREARSAAQLRHPHIVPVHEVGREKDTIFIVSDLVRGASLSDWLLDSSCDARQAAEMTATMADALQHAHEHGVIHRDLKPSNILIDNDGELHLMDFGLAKRDVDEITMTVDGQVLGTPAYMSPEQASGQSHWVDARTDVYSLGVVLFRLITGELPFRGNAQMQIHRRLSEDAPDPRGLNRHIPRDMATICLKCLERDPTGRYETARQLADELRRFVRGEPIVARPVSRIERTIRWCKRFPARAAVAVLTLILAIGGPIAAISIESKRQRLDAMLAEKGNLITQYATDKQRDASQITQLSNSLDLWEGRANPWEFWPPRPENKPRTALLEKLLDQTTTHMESLREDALAPEQRAYSHLSLAMMNEELSREAIALTHYEAAHNLLHALTADQPHVVRYRIALADCLSQMARLSVRDRNTAGQAEKSRELLAKSAEVLAQIPEKSMGREIQIRRLENELYAAVAGGFLSASEHMARAAEIEKQLTSDFPTDPVEVYELACRLARRRPVLATTAAHEE